MSDAPLRVLPLDSAHDRAVFNSGSQPLDRYLREQVNQDMRRRVAACFVALTDEQRIVGYYTLAAASLLLADLPPSSTKKLLVQRGVLHIAFDNFEKLDSPAVSKKSQ